MLSKDVDIVNGMVRTKDIGSSILQSLTRAEVADLAEWAFAMKGIQPFDIWNSMDSDKVDALIREWQASGGTWKKVGDSGISQQDLDDIKKASGVIGRFTTAAISKMERGESVVGEGGITEADVAEYKTAKNTLGKYTGATLAAARDSDEQSINGITAGDIVKPYTDVLWGTFGLGVVLEVYPSRMSFKVKFEKYSVPQDVPANTVTKYRT